MGVEMIQELDISPELLSELKQFAGVAQEQMLEVMNEYLLWWFWEDALTATSLSVVAAICSVVAYKMWRRISADTIYELGPHWFVIASLATAMIPASVCCAAKSTLDAIKITVAPRAYIVDMVVAKGQR